MKIAVFGAGAIGSWMAAALSSSGLDVSLVARGATLATLRQNGLEISDRTHTRRLSIQAGTAAELGAQDVVIIALKAQALPAAINEFRSLLAPHTVVVSAMNGIPWWFFLAFEGPLRDVTLESVDPGGQIAQSIAVSQTLGCVVHASVQASESGHIHVGAVDRLIFGDPTLAQHSVLQTLVNAFNRAGVRSEIAANIRLDIWAKLWGNMNMNPLSALTRATTGRMLDDPAIHALCVRMMEEMAACGDRLGLSLPLRAEERMAITRKLGDFKTSMLQDMESGRSLEFAPQLGAVVEIAKRLQVPAPFCESVLGLIRQLSISLKHA